MTDAIALSMIVKGTDGEAQKLDRVLSSVVPFVDKCFITITGGKKATKDTQEVCKKYHTVMSFHRATWTATPEAVEWLTTFFGYTPHMKAGDEIFLFDEARNFNMNQISQKEYPWILWLDCDDVLVKGENLRTLIEVSQKQHVDAFYFNYLYQVEMEGEKIKNVLIQHLRERLVRNNGTYKWIAPIHETLIEQRPSIKTDTDACEVIHLSSDEDRRKSLSRNLKSLELAIYQTKGEDPRHNYYLAKAFFDLNTPEYNEKSLQLILNNYVGGAHESGWTEERAQAWEYAAELYRRKGELQNAVKCAFNSMIEDEQSPSPFLNLALSYTRTQEWERALFWVRLAAQVPQKKTTLVTNPKDIQARTLEIIFNCCLNLNKVDEAWAAIVKLSELFPQDQNISQNVQFMHNIRTQRDLLKNVVQFAEYLQRSGQAGRIKPLLASVPPELMNNELMMNLYKQNNPPTAWGEKDVAIYCGPGFTPWSPKKITHPGDCFVGGSEEAVCYIAEALQRQGWKVTVYGDPVADEGEIQGVQWLPYYKFNRLDHFNIVIAWRQIAFFDQPMDAKKKYVWNHDIQNPLEYTKERIEGIDKVFFLSEWHRQNVPLLPDSKVFLTSNGVVV